MHFEEFARAELPGSVRFAAVLTGDRELAQDVVQDALVRAHQQWRRVAAADRPELYLRKMVVNGYLSWRRRWYQRSVQATPDVTRFAEAAAPDHADRIVDADRLARLLGALSRAQRAAIVLRFYEDLDDSEIAEVLGCAVGTVRSHISRGLGALRVQIADGKQVAC
ncbi:SigE family RNA polymerase sigma factor [Amycolatopsis mediterranei]|uniref:SigE family RNA polymerase sigma factor n=1 Tax=Amycolatopsis mediterranei TaxID=33910 RepID=UPI0034312902